MGIKLSLYTVHNCKKKRAIHITDSSLLYKLCRRNNPLDDSFLIGSEILMEEDGKVILSSNVVKRYEVKDKSLYCKNCLRKLEEKCLDVKFVKKGSKQSTFFKKLAV